MIKSVSNEVSLIELLYLGSVGSTCCEETRSFKDCPGTSLHVAKA